MKIVSHNLYYNKLTTLPILVPEPFKSQSSKVAELIYYLYTPAVNTVNWCARTIQQCFWYKELDDLSASPDLPMIAVESVKMMQYSLRYKVEIKKLRDSSSIILESLANGTNIDLHWQEMKEIIGNPKSHELIEYISSDINEGHKKLALTLLEVLVGIKPGCFHWIGEFNDDLICIMQKLTVNFPYLKMETLDPFVLFVNEFPIEVFDPRGYLLLQNGHDSSLMEELVSCCVNKMNFPSRSSLIC
ncbi:MAG: hypothetical protein H0T62_07245 [Parachlamydiaceae bacterium]|nr:hypothetical protein [Parachlamydiaceae bacterium]